jgi:hypothetical protein
MDITKNAHILLNLYNYIKVLKAHFLVLVYCLE